jgi:hypothetical protein
LARAALLSTSPWLSWSTGSSDDMIY